ncbi:TPA: GlxA family transcriptional regulator [Vibrio alginolyticus]
MNLNEKNLQQYIKVGFIIPDQYWSGSIALIVDVLEGVNMLIQQKALYPNPLFEIHYLREPGMKPMGMSHCRFETKELCDGIYDVIVIPAVWSITPKSLEDYKVLPSWLHRQSKHNAHFISVTNGAFFLAEAGLINDKEVALHWAFKDLFGALYPNVRVRSDLQTVSTGKTWSSSGINPTIELVYKLIQTYNGEKLAQLCAKYFMIEEQIKPPKEFEEHPNRGSIISAIQSWMDQNYQRPINSKEIAEQFHMSYRNLNRRFSSEIGQAPQAYLQTLRLNRAAKLMTSTKMSVEHVASQCGYSCASALGKAFKRRYDMSPLAYRKFMNVKP